MKKTFTSLALLALVALGTTVTSTPALAETVTESDVITASADAVLTYDKPSVTTVAAPVIIVPVVKATVKVPAKATVKAPAKVTVKVPIKAPVKQEVVVEPQAEEVQAVEVRCEEDMPCWDCATMGNLICGPVEEPVIPEPNLCVPPTLRAEDGSCVNPDFWK